MLRKITIFLSLLFLFAACGEKGGDQLFTKLTKSDTGINFRNILQESDEMNVLLYQYFYNGAGVAIGDVNNDGLPDIFFSGNMAKNRLFLNKGNLNFEDITEQSGVAKMEGWCTGATFVDINADGWLDLYICRSADVQPEMRRNLLFINNGDKAGTGSSPTGGGWEGAFTERAKEYGLDDSGYSTHAAFFDMDKDGDLDCFVINHSLNEYAGDKSEKPGMRQQQNPNFQSKLYQHEANGKFRDVSEELFITGNVLSFGLGLGISDVNGDSWPDIYVCNDFNEQDYLFINRGMTAGGGLAPFKESLADYFDHISHFSMGCDFADFNNDALPDLATVDMLPDDPALLKMHSGPDNWKKFDQLFKQGFFYQSMRNMLHLNMGPTPPFRGAGGVTFSEIGQLAGTSNTDWSWGVLMADFDNDGWKDMVITNGYVKDYTDMDFLNFAMGKAVESKTQGTSVSTAELIKEMPGSKLSKFAFRNLGGAGTLGFESVAEKWGLAETTFSNGIAYADLDNDGDLDLVVNNINDYASIYRNNANKQLKNNWLDVKLVGEKGNPHGYGAKLHLYANGKVQYLEQQPSRGYESSVDHRLHFGLGEKMAIDSLVVTWSDSANSKAIIINPKINQLLTVQQSNAKATPLPMIPNPEFMFFQSDLNFVHHENDYVDFNTQFLLPHFLSRQGPCLTVGDVNGDGFEDVFIGGAAGQPGAILLQDFRGDFAPQKTPALSADATSEDIGAAFFDADGDGDLDLYVASGGYEKPAGDAAYQDRLYLNDGKGSFVKASNALPVETAPGTCVSPGDFDGDGDTDLFVGGGCTPGNYPEAAESLLLINDGKGHFTNKTKEIAPALARPGMVSDAVWLPKERQLVIVGEWMEVLIADFGLRNADGTIRNPQSPIRNSTGWWNRLLATDLDGDGDLDLVAGNHGLNSQMKVSPTEPATLYAADFDGNGSVDPILCHYRHGKSYPAVSRDDLGQQMPSIKKKFNDYKSYSTATIEDIVGKDAVAKAQVLRAEQFRTVWIENTGNGWVLHELPVEAQFAPVYAIAADDFNGDGHPDLFLAGNNRWSRIYFGRYDANHGQVFLGDGRGGFRFLPASQTGISIRADVRDAALVRGKKGNQIVVGVNDGEAQSLYLEYLKKVN